VPIYIALLRGINVVGANSLPMKDLVAILESLDCCQVRTYIQSGNAVFQCKERSAAKLARGISTGILKRRGFEPVTMLLTKKVLGQAMEGNPFPDVEDPTRLGVGVLATVPKNPNLAGLEALRMKNERFAIVGRCFYLHAPDGFGKSKLTSRAEKFLGVAMTMRNWRTVCRIREMVDRM
jgi:uncharacterized protein (DUF1697 family)